MSDTKTTTPSAPATGSANSCETVEECLEWAEGGEMCCGARTERSIRTLAAEVRRLRDGSGITAPVAEHPGQRRPEGGTMSTETKRPIAAQAGSDRCGYRVSNGVRYFVPGCMGAAARGEDYCTCPAPRPFDKRAADALAYECGRAVESGRLDARSGIADALLDYLDDGTGPVDVRKFLREYERRTRRPNTQPSGGEENV